jgi:tetratricopeptide (TPR) repeat protein
MNSKPRRLNEAETLLREALVVMQPGPFGVGGRAATLQKLAQVLERRGKSEDAEYYLKEALRLYQTTYGEDVPHVNVAAVLRNLGEHAFGCKKYDTAKTFLTASLNMRKKLYGNSEGKHWWCWVVLVVLVVLLLVLLLVLFLFAFKKQQLTFISTTLYSLNLDRRHC